MRGKAKQNHLKPMTIQGQDVLRTVTLRLQSDQSIGGHRVVLAQSVCVASLTSSLVPYTKSNGFSVSVLLLFGKRPSTLAFVPDLFLHCLNT